MSAYEDWNEALDRVEQRFDSCDVTMLSQRPPPVQWFVAMRVIEAQVFNGGFCAVYCNYCYEFAPIALAGYKAIGAHQHAALLSRVMESVPKVFSEKPQEEWPNDYPMPDLPSGALDVLEKAWYRLDNELDELKARYVREHPQQFERPDGA
jgi:hypothetical protein